MTIRIEIEIDTKDVDYGYVNQYEEDPERPGIDRVIGTSFVVNKVMASGVDANGKTVRVDVSKWANIKELVEEALHNV